MNKTKSNKKKSCRQVIPPQKKRELAETRNSRPGCPCEPLCALLRGWVESQPLQGV